MMGLKMEDIHSPTVASGPTTSQAKPNGSANDQQPLLELVAEKDRMESELGALSSVLDSHGVHMNTTLTTFDGYPRDDLDIAQIRSTRARIIRLRNDYKDIMTKIETGLHSYYASTKDAAVEPRNLATLPSRPHEARAGLSSSASPANLPDAPFAKVNSVVTGSPADDAGLQAGDEIRRFGDIHFMNHENLSQVADTVQRNQGKTIEVKVTRRSETGGAVEEHQLRLTPRANWGGRGMLGCHLLPV